MKFDNVTFWVFIGIWPAWLIWEIVLLALRGKGLGVDTISMVAKDRAFQMNSLAFTWGGLGAHFWINWYRTRTWSTPVPAIVFWGLIVATLVLDIILWNKPYGDMALVWRWFRNPGMQLLLGMIAGYFLFPQGSR
jgi:hypothetical protein